MGKWYKLNNTDPMPFGKWKGTKMIDVPADYLLFIYKDGEMSQGNVRDYIEENLNVLKQKKENG